MKTKFFNEKTGSFDYPALFALAGKEPSSIPELDFIDDVKKRDLGDSLAYLREIRKALEGIDEKIKDRLLKVSNGRGFETARSHVDISSFNQERLDTKGIRRDMGSKWLRKYTKNVPTTRVEALSLERWQELSEKRGKQLSKPPRKKASKRNGR